MNHRCMRSLAVLSAIAAAVTAAVFALPASADAVGSPWGPETPNVNLEVVLRDVTGERGFGLVKFRQPNNADKIVYLDTWVRDLAPNHSYLLQRAVDMTVDGNCTSAAWVTLGKGLDPQAIATDESGTGREKQFRNLRSAVGTQFDIHFRVVDSATVAAVLESGCYQFTVSL